MTSASDDKPVKFELLRPVEPDLKTDKKSIWLLENGLIEVTTMTREEAQKLYPDTKLPEET